MGCLSSLGNGCSTPGKAACEKSPCRVHSCATRSRASCSVATLFATVVPATGPGTPVSPVSPPPSPEPVSVTATMPTPPPTPRRASPQPSPPHTPAGRPNGDEPTPRSPERRRGSLLGGSASTVSPTVRGLAVAPAAIDGLLMFAIQAPTAPAALNCLWVDCSGRMESIFAGPGRGSNPAKNPPFDQISDTF